MEPKTDPGQVSDPIAFTREHLQQIADVWIEVTKRKLAPYLDKVPAPIARYLKGRTVPAASDAAA